MAHYCVTPGKMCDGCMSCRERKAVTECALCGKGLFAGDDAYKIDGLLYCKDCVEETTIEVD